MRAAVYNRHLETMGGGERYSGLLAAVLAGVVDEVHLVGHGDLELSDLEAHLGIALAGVTLRLVPDRGEAWISAMSADYDLFVNASYMSRVASRARHSSYAVYFPTPWDHDLTRMQKQVARVLGPLMARRSATYEFGLGWFPPEGGRRRSWSWTSGAAEICLPPGPASSVELGVGRPGASSSTEVVLEADGVVLASSVAAPDRFQRLSATVARSSEPRLVQVRSEVFSPAPPDRRELGVAVSGLRVDGRRDPAGWLGRRLPYLLRDSSNLSFLDSYDQVVAISEFTAQWIRRLWGREPELLYPPVRTEGLQPALTQDRLLSIGRFFAEDRGHSKKQLELVRAFVRAQDRGLLAGWELHLVGGCSEEDRPYLDRVRHAGQGHAVHVHANAPRSTVDELLATSSVFWHATGLHEDPDDRPWAMEHFGITTVEAMAAGCVPVVIARAGQREIVTHDVDGFLFEDLDTLIAHTVELANDTARRTRMAKAAQLRAAAFSERAFGERWEELARAVLDRP